MVLNVIIKRSAGRVVDETFNPLVVVYIRYPYGWVYCRVVSAAGLSESVKNVLTLAKKETVGKQQLVNQWKRQECILGVCKWIKCNFYLFVQLCINMYSKLSIAKLLC